MKKTLLSILQIGVTCFALWMVFKNPKIRVDTFNALRDADKRWIVAALVAAAFSPISATSRWWLLLRVQGIMLSWGRVTQLYMIGAFFNLFLPGSTGGDAVKIFYLLREPQVRERRAGAILAVVMDRLIGLLALIILASVFVGLRYHWLTTTAKSSALLASFGFIMGGAILGVVVTLVVVSLRLTDRLPANLPGRAKIIDLATAFEMYARSWRESLLGIGISFVGHCSFFFTYYFAARGVHASISLWDMSVLLPIINTIISLPISVSGVGVRENLFKDLLHDLCGVGAGQAVPISIIGSFCSVLFYGLLGGAFYFMYRSATGAPAAPADTERLEAQIDQQVEKAAVARSAADA